MKDNNNTKDDNKNHKNDTNTSEDYINNYSDYNNHYIENNYINNTNKNINEDAEVNTNTNVNTDDNSNTSTNTNTNVNVDAKVNTNTNTSTSTNVNTDTSTSTNVNVNINDNTNINGDSKVNTNTNTNTSTSTNANANVNINANTKSDVKANTNATNSTNTNTNNKSSKKNDKKDNKDKIESILLIILISIIVFLLLILIILSTKMKSTEKIINNYDEDIHVAIYNLSDCISYKTVEGRGSTIGSNVKYIEFKNINKDVVSKFISNQKSFYDKISLDTEKGYKNLYTSEVNSEINEGIMSTYFKGITKYGEGKDIDKEVYTSYSANIDLNSGSLKTTDQILTQFKTTKIQVMIAILNNIAKNSITETFSKSTTSDVKAETITVSKFKQNINVYAKSIQNKLDNVGVIYIKDGKLNCDYTDTEVLALLGLGNPMDAGLRNNVESLTL